MVNLPAFSRYRRTRFAPSPTGYLHLGHVANAAWVWWVAGRTGAEVVLRIEDHDRGRCRPEYERAILEDLTWLGFPVDPGQLASLARVSPWRQSDVPGRYQRALATLAGAGLVYACECSRREITEAAGPAPAGEETAYPGTCREKGLAPGPGRGLRVRIPDDAVQFTDLRHGDLSQTPATQCGDLLLQDRLGNWTYQFSVVVDDLEQGIDLVVRGDDILPSTGRQIVLSRLLGRSEPPAWLHHPLILAESGVKLSKRDQAESVAGMRERGLTPAAVIELAALATGLPQG